MNVFKFGGASVNSADAVRNMASIIKRYYGESLVVVISAMGKTTNRLEKMVAGATPLSERLMHLSELRDYHLQMAAELFNSKDHPVFEDLEKLFL